MKLRKHLLSLPIALPMALATLVAASPATAAPPESVRGLWDILTGNGYTTLDISAQGGAGAPGASECRHINGFIDIAEIRGFYCPKSGRIHFIHYNYTTDVPVRTFTGAVSVDQSGAMHMAGTYNVLAIAFGNLGEYPFSANR
jgi:hypothetical protein